MTGGVGWPLGKPQPSLPPGLEAARISVRLGAWLIDSVILGVVFGAILLVASAAGAVGINPEAERQLANAPDALPTVAPYVADLPLLAVFATLLVVVNVTYATVLVARFRGLPGQLMLSVQVGDVATGRNLSLLRALLRAVLSLGIPTAGAAGFLYGVVALESFVPWAEVANPQPGGAAELWLSSRAGPMLLAMLAFFIWPVVLLIWTRGNSRRQGLHDLAARSQVVGRSRVPFGYPYASGPMPGYQPGSAPPAWMPGFVPPAHTGSWPATSSPADTLAGGPDAPQVREGPVAPGGFEPQPMRPPEPGRSWLGIWPSRNRTRTDGGSVPEIAPLWPRSADETDDPAKLRGATISRRVTAYLIDSVAVYTIFGLIQSVLVMTVLRSVVPADSSPAAFDERTSILVGLLGGLLQIAYFVPAWAIQRATLGQRLAHIQVADATTGKSLGWMDAFLRWTVMQGPFALVTIVPQVAIGPLVFVATMWTFFLFYSTQNSSDWRGLHDRFVNSRVAQDP
jgi:uncharacterized RDD family membrane protein YckC